jgi:TonB family protein
MDCRQFEKQLWDGPYNLTDQMRQHLGECPKCRETLANYQRIMGLARDGEIAKDDTYWQNFDNIVWEKIDKQNQSAKAEPFILKERRSLKFSQMALAISAAAAVVIFMIIAIKDISLDKTKPNVVEKQYRTIDVTLKSGDSVGSQGAPLVIEPPATKKAADKQTVALSKDIAPKTKKSAKSVETKRATDYTSSEADTFGKMNAPMAAPQIMAEAKSETVKAAFEGFSPGSMQARIAIRDNQTKNDTLKITDSFVLQNFSIIAEPKVATKKEDKISVAIDGVYLTDDGLKNNSYVAVQSVSQASVVGNQPVELYMTKQQPKPMTDTIEPRIITLEKMPSMKKIILPDYPALAYKLGKEGDVWVKAFVNPDGKVERALIIQNSGSNYGFEDEALKAAYKNEFEPFEINGVKMPVWVIYKVKFVKGS